MNSYALAILAVLVLLVGCRSEDSRASARAGFSSPSTARTPAPPSVGQGGGETPEGRSGESTATPAITVVTSALEAETPAPESDNRAREAERLPVRASGAAGPTPAPSTPTSVKAADGQYSAAEGSLEAEVWAAIQVYFSASEWATAMRVARCESGGTFDPAIVGAHGERGIYQIRPEFWGSVPPDIDGQTAMAASIVARHFWIPWSCVR